MTLDEFLSRFNRVRKSGNGYSAQCPAHDDKKNSLSITPAEEKYLINCHVGCPPESILSAVGLNMSDLFTSNDHGGSQDHDHRAPVVARYPYHDEHGALLYTICRTATKGFFPERTEDGALVYNLKGVRRVLYNLPAVIKSKSVLLVEGEKDSDTLKVIGLVATTAPFGAGKWSDEYAPAFKGKRVAILADNDDAGRRHAWQVAKSIISVAETVKLIEQLPGLPEKGDVSDFLKDHTKEELLKIIKEAEPSLTLEEVNSHKEEKTDEWPEPQPLVMDTKSEPYPLDALPETVHAAVDEMQQFTKAPVALVASSALAALSVAIQAHVDMKRAEMLSGPVGLFLLTIADSGERKSTCDRLFTDAIRQYEAEQTKAGKPKVKEYKSASEAWEAKRAGIKDKIRQLAKEKKATVEYERTLRDLETDKPNAPRVPRLIYTDATPEALKWNLATAWPSAGVICAEAGIVFGSHGMGQDSIMRNLTTLNELWDGRPISTDRRTSESFTVRGARLTLGLQIQEATLRSFFDRSNGLPRGTGFMARFLIAWPESTQGTRHFTEPHSNSPGLSAFNRSISNILNKAVPVDDDGALTPPMLGLTPEAKTAWITFHDKIESQLTSGGALYDVRDVASKAADNAVRLSALLQVFEKGMGESIGPVEVEVFENASRIVAWHLSESRRFLGELALPVELVNAAHLDNWLIEYCRRNGTQVVTTRTVQQFGPSQLRDKKALDSALSELEELERARTAKDGRRRIITINPALIEGSKA